MNNQINPMESVNTLLKNETSRLTLSGNQDVRNANELHRTLTELLSKNNSISIQCGEVVSLDAACLQLLLAAKREAQNGFEIIADPECEASRWIQYSGLANVLLGDPSTSSVA